MFKKNEKAYILFINLILITLLGLIVPLLIQQQLINFKIINNRILVLKNKTAVESALEYQLYLLKEDQILLNETFKFNQAEIIINGKEEENHYYLKAKIKNEIPYNSEMIVEKDNFNIKKKITYRSD